MTTWVLLRGLGREARHWGRFPAALQARLPAGDRVLAIDLPGNGRLHAQRSPTRVAGMVAAARAQLAALDAPGPFVLVALSLGGMVAAQWAQDAPHEVAGCVLVNSSLGAFSPFWERLRPGRWPLLLRCLLPGTSHWQRERTLYRITSAHRLDAAVVEDWVAFARTQPVASGNLVRQLMAAARFRAPDRCAVAALVLSSAGDRLVSPRCSQAIATHWRLPHRVHPDAGHDLPLDDPDWVAGAIAGWHAATARNRTPDRIA